MERRTPKITLEPKSKKTLPTIVATTTSAKLKVLQPSRVTLPTLIPIQLMKIPKNPNIKAVIRSTKLSFGGIRISKLCREWVTLTLL
jgi:hypothetical protein